MEKRAGYIVKRDRKYEQAYRDCMLHAVGTVPRYLRGYRVECDGRQQYHVCHTPVQVLSLFLKSITQMVRIPSRG